MSKTVYAVSKGCYSNYRVVALFSKKADAKLFIERHPDDSYSGWNDIETYEMDSWKEQLNAGYTYYAVSMFKDGSLYDSEDTDDIANAVKPATAYQLQYETSSECFYSVDGDTTQHYFNWYGWVKNREHAIKCANEHRIMLLALEGASK